MAKLKHLWAAFLFLTSASFAHAQGYAIHYRSPESDTLKLPSGLDLQQVFKSRTEATLYISGLPSLLRSKGYLSASLDQVQYDSLSASAIVFLGDRYQWTKIET